MQEGIIIHFLKDGKWSKIPKRKGGKQFKLHTEQEADAIGEQLIADGATYVEMVRTTTPRQMYKQLGDIPSDE